jgi:predicted ester cyclase
VNEDKNELVARAWAAYDRGDEETFAACLTDDWREYDGTGDSASLDDVVASMRLHRSAFPDKKTTVEQWVTEGDIVVARSVTTATQTGQYLDLEPSGRTVRISEISIHRIQDGLIAETWQETGGGGFYEQLTGRPAPPEGDNMA